MVKTVALNLDYQSGQTPLDPDELVQLIPSHLMTQQDLDEWEQTNILSAQRWLKRQRKSPVLTEAFCRELHRRMFDQTWRWAGQFRTSDKNIGCEWQQIPMRLRQLLDNTDYQLMSVNASAIDGAAARFHHALVCVHPFPNGNGRHARLMADALLISKSAKPFSWGGHQLTAAGEARARYIQSLRAADVGDLDPLISFVRT